jgi:lysine/ornithine N-monooxygenase
MHAGRARRTDTVVIGHDPLGIALAGAVALRVEAPAALFPVVERDTVTGIEVAGPGGRILTERAILSSGRHPHIPEVFVPHVGRTVFHASEMEARIGAFGPGMPARWLVVGSGPAATDAANRLRDRRPDALIAVAAGVERVGGTGGVHDVVFRDDTDGRPRFLPVDAILLATGYEQPRIPPVLAEFLPWLRTTEDGALAVDGEDRVRLRDTARVEVFVVGLSGSPPGIYETPFAHGAATRMERILLSPPKKARQTAH